jgi:N-acetylglucosaminyldiphosphoundecaprenol N-acetyl-beta-D-mannosaminyltransferase
MSRLSPPRRAHTTNDDRPATRRQMSIGRIWIDMVTFDDALDRIAALVRAQAGGIVLTPNVDHIVTAEDDERFRAIYERASLVLVDGVPVVWASRLLGTPLPEKVSGSDLMVPLARLAAASGWRVYLLGGAPGTAAVAAARLSAEYRVSVVGYDAPMVSPDGVSVDEAEVMGRIRRAQPQLVLVALGAPKQEFWIERAEAALGPAVAVAVGAGLEFVAGRLRRAPRWISTCGLEWLYRLAQEPRRLGRRYLLRDPRFVAVVARTLRLPTPLRLRQEQIPMARHAHRA